MDPGCKRTKSLLSCPTRPDVRCDYCTSRIDGTHYAIRVWIACSDSCNHMRTPAIARFSTTLWMCEACSFIDREKNAPDVSQAPVDELRLRTEARETGGPQWHEQLVTGARKEHTSIEMILSEMFVGGDDAVSRAIEDSSLGGLDLYECLINAYARAQHTRIEIVSPMSTGSGNYEGHIYGEFGAENCATIGFSCVGSETLYTVVQKPHSNSRSMRRRDLVRLQRQTDFLAAWITQFGNTEHERICAQLALSHGSKYALMDDFQALFFSAAARRFCKTIILECHASRTIKLFSHCDPETIGEPLVLRKIGPDIVISPRKRTLSIFDLWSSWERAQ